jgi:hypothetical protein
MTDGDKSSNKTHQRLQQRNNTTATTTTTKSPLLYLLLFVPVCIGLVASN